MLIRRILIVLFTAGLFGFIVYGYAVAIAHRGEKLELLDFTKFYFSAQALYEGADIYRSVPLRRNRTL